MYMAIGWKKKAVREAPCLPGNFLFGSLRALHKNPLQLLDKARSLDDDLVKMRFGPYRVYLFLNPDYIYYVLHENPGNYLKEGYDTLEPLVGRGLLSSEGEFWRHQRRLVRPAFHKKRLEGMAETMTDVTSKMLDRWRKHLRRNSEDDPLDINEEMTRLSLEIVSRTLFGSDASESAIVGGRALGLVFEYGFQRIGRVFPIPFAFPTPKNLRYREAIRTLDRIVYSLIDARRSGRSTGEGDVLSMLLDARTADTGELMTEKQLRDEVMTILVAGYETTARALAWTWYLLDRNPQVRHKLREELHRGLGGRTPTAADVPKLAYTEMVVQESLRLYPPVWGLARRVKETDEVGGYRIRKGSRIIISPYATQRHPALWTDPEKFDPERFTDEASAGRPSYAYFPFSGGPRRCIGANFAMMELQLVLATVAQTFELALVPGHLVEPEASFTLRPRHGMPMTLREES